MVKDYSNLLCNEEKVIDELYLISSLVDLLKTSCFSKEMNSSQYVTIGDLLKNISIERNNYINILELVSDKILYLINLNNTIENEIPYYLSGDTSTPTIAADK